MSIEEQYKKELQESGVDLESIGVEEQPKPKVEEPEVNPKVEEPEVNPKVEEPEVKPKVEEPSEEPQPKDEETKTDRKRSIYQDYKTTKKELKSEKEIREQLESENKVLVEKIKAYENAPKEDKQDKKDDLDAYAEEIGADPVALKKMKEIFLKDVKTQETDPTIKKELEEFKTWKSQNDKVLDKQMFESEFNSTIPFIKDSFPNVSDEELMNIKTKLDEISHTPEWHDKDLEYIVFKHKQTLSSLTSPKVKGIEGRSRKDVENKNFEFNPSADYAQMSPLEREKWEEEYKKASKTGELSIDSTGRRLLL